MLYTADYYPVVQIKAVILLGGLLTSSFPEIHSESPECSDSDCASEDLENQREVIEPTFINMPQYGSKLQYALAVRTVQIY